MNKWTLLAISFLTLAIAGCASQTQQAKANYESSTQSLLNQLPENANRAQVSRQLELIPQGRYLTLSGEIVDIPRARIENDPENESFIPLRHVEDIEEAEEPAPIRIRIIDGK